MTINILVPVKRVVDANVRVRVSGAGLIDTSGLKMSLNPFDECALEKALQLREVGIAASVSVVSCGAPVSIDVLRTALAMGADNAFLVDTDGVATDPLGIARLLHAFMCERAYGLVLCGKQAIDDDIGGVAAMLAGLLDWPQALNASAIDAKESGWQVCCGDDSGTTLWQLHGPAVISADLRLAEPRRVTLPNIVKAKQKPLQTIPAHSLRTPFDAKTRIATLREPASRQAGIKVADTTALLLAVGQERLFQNVGAR